MKKLANDINEKIGIDVWSDDWSVEIIEDRDTQLSFSALGQDAPIEEKKLWDPDQKKRQKIKVFLEPMLPEVTIIIGGTTTLDILSKGLQAN